MISTITSSYGVEEGISRNRSAAAQFAQDSRSRLSEVVAEDLKRSRPAEVTTHAVRLCQATIASTRRPGNPGRKTDRRDLIAIAQTSQHQVFAEPAHLQLHHDTSTACAKMPHKHTRKGGVDKSTIDLPPTTIAKPLSVSKSSNSNSIFTTEISNTRRTNKKRKRNADTADDTPKAFARLMAFSQGKKLPKGLDDGVRLPKKKAKQDDEGGKDDGNDGMVAEEKTAKEVPTIRPGERMAEFAARVDAALPVSGLINKTARGGKDPLGLKVGRTKKEKKMHRIVVKDHLIAYK
ncbi:hypothetical protein G7Y89_g1633 [Cudoniella acicularis]|uniref:Uncharacterized protein n=1 Tax=Cudoniella acicularis TaxID=354080 RepID=A0A8H4RUX4_9HELO|nr:hypothetical protein G7Y89_g1633 [Cudoniella acicularis]